VPDPPLLATIRWGSIGPLVVTSLAIMGSPGPATVSLTAVGSACGVRRSLAYLAGIIGGTVVVLGAVATGITTTLLVLPALRVVLIVVSAAYIVWLAYHIATAPPLAAGAAPAADAPSLAGGMLLGLANPKGWIAIATVFASARLADSPTTDAAAKTVALTVMVVAILTAWLIAGTFLARLLRDPRQARFVNVALAAVLVGSIALTVLR
jgi:threonine/homoserine/homoserine lactone efflux protein